MKRLFKLKRNQIKIRNINYERKKNDVKRRYFDEI